MLGIKKEIEGNKFKIFLSGEFTRNFRQIFEQEVVSEVEESSFNEVEIDLSKIKLINSGGLGALLILDFVAKGKKAKITLSNPNKDVLYILEKFKFQDIFEIKNP